MPEGYIYKVFISGTSKSDKEKRIACRSIDVISKAELLRDRGIHNVALEAFEYHRNILEPTQRLQTGPTRRISESDLFLAFIKEDLGSDPGECDIEPYEGLHFISALVEELVFCEHRYEHNPNFERIFFLRSGENHTNGDSSLLGIIKKINDRRYEIDTNEIELEAKIQRVIIDKIAEIEARRKLIIPSNTPDRVSERRQSEILSLLVSEFTIPSRKEVTAEVDRKAGISRVPVPPLEESEYLLELMDDRLRIEEKGALTTHIAKIGNPRETVIRAVNVLLKHVGYFRAFFFDSEPEISWIPLLRIKIISDIIRDKRGTEIGPLLRYLESVSTIPTDQLPDKYFYVLKLFVDSPFRYEVGELLTKFQNATDPRVIGLAEYLAEAE